MQLLLQLPYFTSVDLAQGLLGAKTPKPTRLLVLNMPDLPKWLNAHRICKELPRSVAIGHSPDGHWATSELKEYPPAFNRALAECFSYHMLRSTVDDSVSAPIDFLNRCKSMHVDKFGSRIGADFHRTA